MRAPGVREGPDEAFWGPARRRPHFPLSGSVLVDAMVAAVGVVVVATIVALVVLWPAGGSVRSRSIAVTKTHGARVSHVASVRCAVAAAQLCQVVTATLLDGHDKGTKTTFDFLP